MTYRSMLREEHKKRATKNTKYSLRAFARDLEMHPGRLVSVLKGHYGISPHAARGIAEKLNFTPEQTTLFYNLVKAQHGRSRKERDEAIAQMIDAKTNQPTPVEFEEIKEILSYCVNVLRYDPQINQDKVRRLLQKFGLEVPSGPQ